MILQVVKKPTNSRGNEATILEKYSLLRDCDAETSVQIILYWSGALIYLWQLYFYYMNTFI